MGNHFECLLGCASFDLLVVHSILCVIGLGGTAQKELGGGGPKIEMREEGLKIFPAPPPRDIIWKPLRRLGPYIDTIS